ncbi:hypothetical protein [Parabacteroides sp.]
MKQLKDIVLTGFLALLVFTACTEEKLIDEQPVETGTVSISFSTEGVDTKAISADGTYEYATADELTINSIFVSIFKKVNGKWEYLTSKPGHLGDGSFVGTQSSGSFKLTGLTLPLNTELKVVAIANPLANKVASYASMDYQTLSAEIVSYTATLGGEGYYTFDPKTLIKVGEEEMTFTLTGGLIKGGKPVSLKQLAAKVHLKLEVDLPELEGSTTTSDWNLGGFTLTELTKVLNKDLMNSASTVGNAVTIYKLNGKLGAVGKNVKIPEGAVEIAKAMNGNGCSHVECNVGATIGDKCAHLTITLDGGITVEKIESTPKWLFNLKTVQILNVNTESNLIISEDEKNLLSKLLDSQLKTINKACSTVEIVLYTYEREKADGLQKALIVDLVGEFALGADIKKYIYKMKGNFLHPYWENGSGWGDGSSKFYLYQKDLELEGEPSSSEEITSSGEGTDYKYSISINPEYKKDECTDGLIHGNYYNVTGTLKRSAGEFKIWVAPWVTKNVAANFK